MTRKVFVTGAGGFLGGHIARILQEEGGYEVVSFSRSFYDHLKKAHISQIQGDLKDKRQVEEALKSSGASFVIHTAATTDMWGPWEKFYQTNVVGTKNILEASRKFGIDRFVYTSSPSVVFGKEDLLGVDEDQIYPEKYLSLYACSKAMAEKMVIAENDGEKFCTVSLRPHLIWGPGDRHLLPRLLERARLGKLRQVGSGQNKVDVIYVENAARAHLQALEKLKPGSHLCGKNYFIGQEDPVLLWPFINTLLELHHIPPVKKKVPQGLAYSIGWAMEKVFSIIPGLRDELPPMTRFLSLQLSKSHYFDHGRANRDFDYNPLVSIEEGLEKFKTHLNQ